MKVDPLSVRCRKRGCGASPGSPCVRLTSYGAGAPLRRAHRERYAYAREVAARRARGRVRRAAR